jgi:6-phosphogluconolactonase
MFRPIALALPLVLGLAVPHGQQAAAENATLVYVGTYTNAKSQGIYAFRLPAEGLALAPLGLAAETPNPSFLEIDAKRGLLFAVNETSQFEGKPTGAVSAWRIDRGSGRLTLINQRAAMGTSPCHLALDRTGRFLFVANYSSGNIAAFPVAADGRLGEPTAVVQHRGSSVDPGRQKGPHAHCMVVDAANRYVFACDLGLDQILVYRFDAEKGTLTPHDPPHAAVKAGAGPRHMAFRPDHRFAYVINELDSTVTVFAYDAKAGRLTAVQTLSTLPAGFEGKNSTAEIAVDPAGRHVYASNRGHDSVTVFRIEQAAGTLTYVDTHPTGGRTPRHFALGPDGRRIFMANQASDTIVAARPRRRSRRCSWGSSRLRADALRRGRPSALTRFGGTRLESRRTPRSRSTQRACRVPGALCGLSDRSPWAVARETGTRGASGVAARRSRGACRGRPRRWCAVRPRRRTLALSQPLLSLDSLSRDDGVVTAFMTCRICSSA